MTTQASISDLLYPGERGQFDARNCEGYERQDCALPWDIAKQLTILILLYKLNNINVDSWPVITLPNDLVSQSLRGQVISINPFMHLLEAIFGFLGSNTLQDRG